MLWVPQKLWNGDAFIIGGGDSLRGFDFSRLNGEHVVGCNDAYKLGRETCNICIFGDERFLQAHQKRLAEYVKSGGFVVTNDTHLEASRISWLNWMRKRARGLHHDALGWNLNTGASAINLALLLGAENVYLLGFDRQLGKNDSPNYHDEILIQPKPETYPKMNMADAYMKRDLKKKFPGCHVWNVTDKSKLDVWPKIPAEQFWSERKRNERIAG